MIRFLYNMSEWFNDLEIHQQIIYLMALLTPTIVGVLTGTVISIFCGHLSYLIGLWIKEKGDKIRREAQTILRHYDHKFGDMNAWRGYHEEYKERDLIGHIMVEKRFDPNSSYETKDISVL
ncbi:MAG: hypothetical protein V3U54_08720 [Thermodesulfobacteriota bacterium]